MHIPLSRNTFIPRSRLRTIAAVVVAVLYLVISTQLRAAEEFQVVGATIFGGSSILVRTNATKVSYSTVLSDDKQRLTLTVRNAGIKSEQREFNAPRGPIESAIMQKIGRDVVLNIYFRQPSGYTAVLMPYSRSLSVDVFQWSGLSTAEDQYRSGLIALQNNVMSVAKDMIFAAAQARHPDATAFAGFVSAREGNFVDAKDYFLKALERKSSLGDIYGGLAQVSRIENNEQKAREYENQFVQRLGRPPYFDEEQLKIQKVVPPSAEPASLAALSSPQQLTSTSTDSSTANHATEQGTDSLMKQLRSLQGETVARASQQGDSALQAAQRQTPIFAWMNSALIGVGVGLILIGIVFLRGYSRWKKQQLSYLERAQQSAARTAAFGANLQQAIAVSDEQAINVYKRSASLLDRVDEVEAESSQSANQEHSQTKTPTPVSVPSPKKSEATKPDEDLFDFDESFYASRKKDTPAEPKVQPTSDAVSPLFNTPAELQLSSADPIQAAAKTPETLPPGSLLDVDTESLEALASQLGIDPKLMASVRKRKSGVVNSKDEAI